jgi:hypothetical protein
MRKNVSEAAFSIIKKMQQNELTESYIYEAISKFAKGENNEYRIPKRQRNTS